MLETGKKSKSFWRHPLERLRHIVFPLKRATAALVTICG